MSRFTVLLTGPAVSDLQAIRSYIAGDDARAAAHVAKALIEAINGLETLPNRGRPGRSSNTRELIVPGWPWIVAYEVVEARVTVLRVLHGAQKRS
jgi:addiction module RelE/StbE family toxin